MAEGVHYPSEPEPDFEYNEHGAWCPVCGDLVASSFQMEDEDFIVPSVCRQCGFPDEIDRAAKWAADNPST